MNQKYYTDTRERMTDLPKLMQADCGHFIPADSPPSARRYDSLRQKYLPIYLCEKCQPAQRTVPTAETKAVSGS